MAAILAYFLWIFAVLSAILLLVLARAVLRELVQPLSGRFSGTAAVSGYVLFVGFVATTYVVGFEAGREIFQWSVAGLPLVQSWADSARLALINVTLLSILGALTLAFFRAWRSMFLTVAPTTSVLSGRLGRIVNVLITVLSVVSSLLTIGAALGK